MALIVPVLPDGLYAAPKGQLLLQAEGDIGLERFGDTDQVQLTSNAAAEIERYSTEYPTSTLAERIVDRVDVTIESTLMQLTPRNRALGVMGQVDNLTQDAATSATMTINNVVAGRAYQLPRRNLSALTATDGVGTPVTYVLNTHYTIDFASGLLFVIEKPGTAGANLVLTYSAPAIVENDQHFKTGIGTNPTQRGKLIYVGTNARGPRSMLELWNVELRPNGPRSYIGTELTSIPITGRVFPVSGKPAGYELGQETHLG